MTTDTDNGRHRRGPEAPQGPSPDDSGVQLVDIHHTYQSPAGPFDALRGIDLHLRDGASTAIVGRSGSGKSTLVSIMALLRTPTRGRVVMWGQDVSTLPDHQVSDVRGRQVGVVFQSFHLDPTATALENVLLPSYFRPDIPRRTARRTAMDKLDLVGVADLARRRPGEMSGGQRQRIAVARALLTDPRLLIADEPTGNLDEETAQQVAEEIFQLAPRLGTTVVVVTHDSDIAAQADAQVAIVGGRVVGEDPA